MSKINLTDEQSAEVKAVWAVYDKDKNGSLDKNEMRNFLFDLNEYMCSIGFPSLTEKRIDEIIFQTDKNGDGKVDYDEFAKAFIL